MREWLQIEATTAETKTKNQKPKRKMKIVKNNSTLTDQEVICRVEAFDKFFSEIFPTPIGQQCFCVMPDGTVSSYSSIDPEIIVDYSV